MASEAAANMQPEDQGQDMQFISDAGMQAAEEDVQVFDSGVSDAGVQASVKAARFAPLTQGNGQGGHNSMDLIMDVALDLSVELGRTALPVREVLQMGPGSIVELDKMAGQPVDVLVNGRPIARGEVVVVDENFGVRITEIVNRADSPIKME